MTNVSLAELTISRDDSPDGVLSLLGSHGIAVIPNYLSNRELDAVRQECVKLERDQSPGITERQYHCGRSLLVDRRKWDPQVYPSIETLMNARFLRDIATGYFSRQPAFNYQFLLTRETASGVPITGLHYDRLITLKFFIYLLDTTKDNGAFECIPGTHKSVEETRRYYVKRGVRLFDLPNFTLPQSVGTPIPMEGSAGTMLVFTTDVVHQGGVVSEGKERWVLRAHTRSNPIPEYWPRPWASRQWWRESLFNPERYVYRLRDTVLRNRPPLIRPQ